MDAPALGAVRLPWARRAAAARCWPPGGTMARPCAGSLCVGLPRGRLQAPAAPPRQGVPRRPRSRCCRSILATLSPGRAAPRTPTCGRRTAARCLRTAAARRATALQSPCHQTPSRTWHQPALTPATHLAWSPWSREGPLGWTAGTRTCRCRKRPSCVGRSIRCREFSTCRWRRCGRWWQSAASRHHISRESPGGLGRLWPWIRRRWRRSSR
mmetsp:Transcript_61612/g.183585  ORF Transcript_61612/g.183585 Transcript_61612/m.183585 type:complete len:212 (+) Transcript_61612:65-700(+)